MDSRLQVFLGKVIRFGLIGASGMVIDYGSTYLCKEIFLMDKYVSNLIGFTLAASSNYYFNRTIVFKNEARNHTRQYFGFVGISSVGLILNSLIVWLLTDQWFHFNFYISKTVATGVVFFWNFSMNYFLNFRKAKI